MVEVIELTALYASPGSATQVRQVTRFCFCGDVFPTSANRKTDYSAPIQEIIATDTQNMQIKRMQCAGIDNICRRWIGLQLFGSWRLGWRFGRGFYPAVRKLQVDQSRAEIEPKAI